jgi:hypothetical protein
MGNQPIWLWMNLLSLDAPLIALVWQDLLARCYGTQLLPAGRLVMGLTVWAIYIADRLLDVRGTAQDNEPRHHRFYREHKRPWCAVLATLVVMDATCTLFWLRPSVFLHGLVVAGASIVYLAVFTGRSRVWAFWKKTAAAVLFSSGVFLVTAVNTQDAMQSLGKPWIAFTILCGANLMLIDLWKNKQDTRRMSGGVLICAVFSMGSGKLHLAVTLSFLLLAAIAYGAGRLSLEARRVLADTALLTPMLFR